MSIRWLLCPVLLAASLVVAIPGQAMACGGSADLNDVEQYCYYPPHEVKSMYATGAAEQYRYRISPACDVGGQVTCNQPAECADPPGSHKFDVWRSPESPIAWEVIGWTCLTDADAGELGALTPGMVRSAFRRLQWPAAELSVQPPDGETLVNLDTNFFTTLTDASTQTVTLVGITVEIEATPQEYHWHFGDGADQSTTSPGAAYPHLEITHAYLRKGEVGASVDVVYGGRYRIGGSGGWTDIPGTLTVPGTAVGLTVLEARPQLVG